MYKERGTTMMNKKKLTIEERRQRNKNRINTKKINKWNDRLKKVFSILIKFKYLSNKEEKILRYFMFKNNDVMYLKSDLDCLIDALVVNYNHKLKNNNISLNMLSTDSINSLLRNGFVYIDKFIKKELVSKILYEIENNKKIIWKHPNNHGRDDIITWLKPTDDICSLNSNDEIKQVDTNNNPFHTLLNKILLQYLYDDLIQIFKLKSNKTNFEHQLASYSNGANGYSIHRDCSKDESINGGRKLTCIVYLQDESYNPDIDGGQLLIYKDERPIHVEKIAPYGGSLVIFFSGAIDHVVLPYKATNGKKRIAFTTWLS